MPLPQNNTLSHTQGENLDSNQDCDTSNKGDGGTLVLQNNTTWWKDPPAKQHNQTDACANAESSRMFTQRMQCKSQAHAKCQFFHSEIEGERGKSKTLLASVQVCHYNRISQGQNSKTTS